ncbi:cell division protein FtsX [Roseomonas sp. NAR14]|uniref:Cell division protein FtsX n=1 Tax=Roseomonas acroporae TaxID=2937791 RepID=A0A9X1YCE5_9PROT|nr:FtsX-like permease family protein [Roseomonas acroporae]MCK8787165.1 cell division protein FtsX [Roseomonas acroporae]
MRRALSDRLLPGLVAAMALLAALALGGARGAATLAARWQTGAAAAVLVQVPEPAAPAAPAEGAPAGGPPAARRLDAPPAARRLDGPPAARRLDAALAALRSIPSVSEARPMDDARMQALLRPWLGDAADLPLPGVIELRLDPDAALPEGADSLEARLAAVAPGALVESHGLWVARLGALARSLQAVSLAALLLVAGVAAAVVAVATRAGLIARREAIGVLHTLGATDGDIARRFARRVFALAGAGALMGAALAVPLLAGLAGLAAPLLGGAAGAGSGIGWAWAGLPWAELVALPPLAALIGWATAQLTVRRWLRRLP